MWRNADAVIECFDAARATTGEAFLETLRPDLRTLPCAPHARCRPMDGDAHLACGRFSRYPDHAEHFDPVDTWRRLRITEPRRSASSVSRSPPLLEQLDSGDFDPHSLNVVLPEAHRSQAPQSPDTPTPADGAHCRWFWIIRNRRTNVDRLVIRFCDVRNIQTTTRSNRSANERLMRCSNPVTTRSAGSEQPEDYRSAISTTNIKPLRCFAYRWWRYSARRSCQVSHRWID